MGYLFILFLLRPLVVNHLVQVVWIVVVVIVSVAVGHFVSLRDFVPLSDTLRLLAAVIVKMVEMPQFNLDHADIW